MKICKVRWQCVEEFEVFLHHRSTCSSSMFWYWIYFRETHVQLFYQSAWTMTLFLFVFLGFFIPDMTALKSSTANSRVCSMQSQNCKAFLQQTQRDNKEGLLEPSCKLIIEWRNEGKNRRYRLLFALEGVRKTMREKREALCGARQAPCCDRRCNFAPICTAISMAGQQHNRLHKHSPT